PDRFQESLIRPIRHRQLHCKYLPLQFPSDQNEQTKPRFHVSIPDPFLANILLHWEYIHIQSPYEEPSLSTYEWQHELCKYLWTNLMIRHLQLDCTELDIVTLCLLVLS